MTNANSPLRQLKTQADSIAAALKAAERGDTIGKDAAAMTTAARAAKSITFGVVMDDKTLKIEMPWATIRQTSEAGLSEYIVAQMRGARETKH